MSSAFNRYNNEKAKRQQSEKIKYENENKKAKYEQTNQSISSSNEISDKNDSDLTNTTETLMQFEEEEEELNDNNDYKFIGLDTFNNANILFDLIETSQQQQATETNEDDDDLILLTLNLNEIFCFKGRVMIKILFGCVNINGYNIDMKNSLNFLNLYSPDTHSSQCIINNKNLNSSNSSSSSSSSGSGNFNDLNEKNQIINNILQNLSQIKKYLNNKNQNLINYLNENLTDKFKTILLFKKLKSKLCNYFHKFDNYKSMYQTTHLINYITSPNDIKFAYLGLYPVHSNNLIFLLNQNELEIINKITENAFINKNKQAEIVLACGGKDVGKSTYLRYLVNSLLNKHDRVAYIDCDPGQCEFTLSGNLQLTIISEPLLGPPHTHLQHSTESCYFLGYLSPNDIPAYYLECIRKCFLYYEKLNNESINKIPLIINTMGWNQGLGLCLLKEQISLLKPTTIIQLQSTDTNKNLPIIDYDWYENSIGWPPKKDLSSYSKPNYNLFIINRKPYLLNQHEIQQENRRKLVTYSAKDHRTIAIIAYFSNLQEKQSFFKPIHHIKPYRIPWSHFAVHVAHMKIAYEEIFRVLNASLIGLCRIDEKFIKKPEFDKDLPGYLDFSDSSENDYSYKCYGFGIIRGINMDTKEFYLLTPEPIEKLNQVNLLIKGMLNVPVEFFYEQDSETQLPYVAYVDNLNNRKNVVASEPIQRKFLIHQQASTSDRMKNSGK